MVVNGLLKSSFKLLLLGQTYSLPVVDGTYDTNETTGSLAVFQRSLMVAKIDLKSIPATQSLTVFEDCYWSLQKLHSCFLIVVDSF